MNAWDNLPNGPHIDRVLAQLRAHKEALDAAWPTASIAAWSVAWSAAWSAASSASRGVAMDAAMDAAWSAAWSTAWSTARGAMGALIAWDDCAYMLDLPTDALRVLAEHHHAAVLILPVNISLKV